MSDSRVICESSTGRADSESKSQMTLLDGAGLLSARTDRSIDRHMIPRDSIIQPKRKTRRKRLFHRRCRTRSVTPTALVRDTRLFLSWWSTKHAQLTNATSSRTVLFQLEWGLWCTYLWHLRGEYSTSSTKNLSIQLKTFLFDAYFMFRNAQKWSRTLFMSVLELFPASERQ